LFLLSISFFLISPHPSFFNFSFDLSFSCFSLLNRERERDRWIGDAVGGRVEETTEVAVVGLSCCSSWFFTAEEEGSSSGGDARLGRDEMRRRWSFVMAGHGNSLQERCGGEGTGSLQRRWIVATARAGGSGCARRWWLGTGLLEDRWCLGSTGCDLRADDRWRRRLQLEMKWWPWLICDDGAAKIVCLW
jgi:hypothetical protein